MSNTIQNLYLKDMSKYMQNIKLGTTMKELLEKQNEERRGSFAAVSYGDAAAVEISELARTMYAQSSEGAAKSSDTAAQSSEAAAKPSDTSAQPPEAAAKTSDTAAQSSEAAAKTSDTAAQSSEAAAKYQGLSGAERERKELEDYIAGNPVDTSLDLLKNTHALSQYDPNAVNGVDEDLVLAEKEYQEAFGKAAEDFADFSMKITYGNYSSNDVSVQDLNFDAIDKMADLYDSYKEHIQSNYEGSEQEKYLNKLDEAYNAVFAEKIIAPVKRAYDNKLTFVQPDSYEAMQSIKASSTSSDRLNEMISGYIANQAVRRKQHGMLAEGMKDFYDMAEDSSLWHDTAAVKNILTDTMKAYASVKESAAGSSDYLSAKAAADAAAKKVSDKYAEMLAYKEERLGMNQDGKDTEGSRVAQASINNYMKKSNGIFTIEFSEIADVVDSMIDNLAK